MGLLATLSYIERKFDSASLEQEYQAAPAAEQLPDSKPPPRDELTGSNL
jgi:methylaspartate mutase epsilon subunit